MAQSIGLKTPIKVIPGDGSLASVYEGTALFGFVHTCVVAAVAVTRGMALVLNKTTAVLQAENFGTGNTALVIGDNVLAGRPSNTTGGHSNLWLGIALEAAAIGEECDFLGPGSLGFAFSAASSGTVGEYAIANATNGQVQGAGVVGAAPLNGLGIIYKPSGAASPTGGATDTGSNNRMAVLVMPQGAVAS